MISETVPVIDLSRDTETVAAGIHAAATRIGFFYVSGHGISRDIIDEAFAASRLFFEMPEEIKRTVAIGTDQRGWMGPGMSKMAGAVTHDAKEVFFWGREVAVGDPDLGRPMVAPNRWPDETVPCLREGIAPYYDAVCGVGARVMEAVAVALGGVRGDFAPFYERPLARGQAVYYPPMTEADRAAGRFGVAPHTDFGVLTLLLQDDSGGLQVRRRDGEWIEAPPLPGTLVCNIGDLLQRWSNDRFISTVHRVVNRSTGARMSIPVFYDPNTDAVVDPRLFLGAGEAAKHEPITPGEHIAGRNRESFSQYATKAGT